ncbi:endo-1,4-beta xylanase [Heliocybe sulcata]|uniref:Beta-xylanase n=1 Tax=Heliocybe sulcata TaxID=5364 RepID=A0A5C3MTA7_9AGAM|nr:endo-1,4-beta xylanase [Heliocybe sulcata]
MAFKPLLLLLLLLPASLALPYNITLTARAAASTSTAKLHTLATAAGKKYFGTAVDGPDLNDAAYLKILNDKGMFGQVTAANAMKWARASPHPDATEPSAQGQFTFTAADKIATAAKKNGQVLRGHNCVWHNQLPSWVSNGGFSAAQLSSILTTHCSTLVSRYKGQVYSWDVVNEPFNEDGSQRSFVFTNTLGTSYISTVLKAARAADPTAKLYINDFNIEFSGAKSTAMLNLVKSLQSQNVPIDGIGLQSHFQVGKVPASLKSVMQQFTALGVEVAITELDIAMALPATQAQLAQQKKDYQSVIQTCMEVSGCVGVTLWDFTDKYSWIPGTEAGKGAACPWDENFAQKQAFDGIAAGFQS